MNLRKWPADNVGLRPWKKKKKEAGDRLPPHRPTKGKKGKCQSARTRKHRNPEAGDEKKRKASVKIFGSGKRGKKKKKGSYAIFREGRLSLARRLKKKDLQPCDRPVLRKKERTATWSTRARGCITHLRKRGMREKKKAEMNPTFRR